MNCEEPLMNIEEYQYSGLCVCCYLNEYRIPFNDSDFMPQRETPSEVIKKLMLEKELEL